MYYGRRKDDLADLLRWRRNIFIQIAPGRYVLVSATRYLVALHEFDSSYRQDPIRTRHLEQDPAELFDGYGWKLFPLMNLLTKEETNMQAPFTGFYSLPLRETIRNLSDIALRLYVTMATYADESGTCWPGVRELADKSGLGTDDVSEGLRQLQACGLMRYLRYNAVDPLTKRIQANVYNLNGAILVTKQDSGIQTYMNEFLNPGLSGKPAQPYESKNQNQESESEPESETTTTNHHQEPAQAREKPEIPSTVAAGAAENAENAKSGKKDQDKTPAAPTPAPNGAASGAAATRPPTPRSAPPPAPDAGKSLAPYKEPLPDNGLEALANELYFLMPALPIAKARLLVDTYGLEAIETTVAHYRRQPTGSLKNPPGWFVAYLRQSALDPVFDGAAKERAAYANGAQS